MTASNQNYFPKCFFIYDDFYKDEAANPEDIILFFWPEEVPQKEQTDIHGSCGVIVDFKVGADNSDVPIVELGKMKFTFKKIGKFRMVLVSDISDSNVSLLQEMDFLWKGFQFFNGSFQILLKNCNERKSAKNVVRQAMRNIVHLISKYLQTSLHYFNAFPYFNIPSAFCRHFVYASQLLNAIGTANANLGGCILYRDRVICTHLDMFTTRWIVALVDGLELSKKENTQNQTNSEENSQPNEYLFSVFIPKCLFYELKEMKKTLLSREIPPTNSNSDNKDIKSRKSMNDYEIQSSLAGLSETRNNEEILRKNESVISNVVTNENTIDFSIEQKSGKEVEKEKTRRKSLSDDNDTEDDMSLDMVNVALFIVSVSRIVLGVIMETGAANDEQHVNKIRFLAKSKLYDLGNIFHSIKESNKVFSSYDRGKDITKSSSESSSKDIKESTKKNASGLKDPSSTTKDKKSGTLSTNCGPEI
jgi:hypothetical protein